MTNSQREDAWVTYKMRNEPTGVNHLLRVNSKPPNEKLAITRAEPSRESIADQPTGLDGRC